MPLQYRLAVLPSPILIPQLFQQLLVAGCVTEPNQMQRSSVNASLIIPVMSVASAQVICTCRLFISIACQTQTLFASRGRLLTNCLVINNSDLSTQKLRCIAY